MKKRSVIFWLLLMSVLRFSSPSFAYYYVCVDPGHGGNDPGAVGTTYNVSEKDANLAIALLLKNKIEFYIAPVLMTRMTDTTVLLGVRVDIANLANGGAGVNQFISVHHNSASDTSVNGTETYFCNAETTDAGTSRGVMIMYGARDSTFAKKLRLVLRDSLHLTYRCSPQHLCGDTTQPCCMNCFYVLRNTIMQSVLSEASFITNPWVEYQFKNNTDYINKEAGAICTGWWSTYLQGGIAVIRNGYSEGLNCGRGGVVGVGDLPYIIDTVDSPHEACWLMTSIHYLKAVSPQYINGHLYTFHHWTHFLPSGVPFDTHNDPAWDIMVPAEFDYHKYVAYFTGGPFSARLNSPNGGEKWSPGDNVTISWDATTSYGADSTTLVDVYLDRHNGSTSYPETICTSIPRKYSLSCSWTVTSPLSDSCRIKIVAHDVAGNQAYYASDYMFSIKGSSVTLLSPNGGEIWEAGSTHQITWSYFRIADFVKIYYSTDAGTTWQFKNDSTYTGNCSYNWNVPNSPYTYTQCRIKIQNRAYPTILDISDNFLTITAGPLSTPTISAQRDCYEYIPGVLISWPDNNVHELGYKIERRDSTSAWQEVASTGINGTSFRNRDLRGSEVYFYQVRAYNQARYSAYSNVASAKFPPNLPSNYTAYVYTGNGLIDAGFSGMIQPNGIGPPPPPGHPTNAVILHWGAPSNQKLPIRYYRIIEEWYGSGFQNDYVTPYYGYGDTICPLMKDASYYFYVYGVDWQGDSCRDCRARSSLLHTGTRDVCPGSISKLSPSIPKEFALNQNFPNPFNPQTEINFSLPEPAFVTLKIYNILGQAIRTLVNQRIESGSYSVVWDGLDDNNKEVSSGIYFYKIQAGKFRQAMKMILTK